MIETELHHDDIARDIEQKVDGVTYVESEGPTVTRVDFGGESIWFGKYEDDIIAVDGNLSSKNFKAIKKCLKQYGDKVRNDTKEF